MSISATVIIVLVATLAVTKAQFRSSASVGRNPNAKVVCHYNATSFLREGLGKLISSDLDTALPFCTHLVYGWVGLDRSNNKVKSLNENLDLDAGKGQLRAISQTKRRFPHLKVFLGIGGGADPDEDFYSEILESSASRTAFINSAYNLVKSYDFDGVDLAWQFRPNKGKRIRSSLGSAWYNLKKFVGAAGKPLDEKANEHKEGYVALVRELKYAFLPDHYGVALTVLPNVNTTLFYDIPNLIQHVDFITLAAFDFQTWNRNPYEADYPAPIYEALDRNPFHNLHAQVNLWLAGSPNVRSKLVVGIPTHGRTWTLTEDSTKTGVPPIQDVEEPGPEGVQTKEAGLLSWPEICAKLPNPSNSQLRGEQQPLRKVGDPTKKFGSYAYRLPDANGKYGLWVGYEDPETAQVKAEYAVTHSLGGIAIFDLSNDDFRGTCTGDKYPILRAAKFKIDS